MVSAGETEILVEQKQPQGVFVCDHDGLVIKKYWSCNQGNHEIQHPNPQMLTRSAQKVQAFRVGIVSPNKNPPTPGPTPET
jgi:hypothetical protein